LHYFFFSEIDKLSEALKQREAAFEDQNKEISNLRQQLTSYDKQLQQTVQVSDYTENQNKMTMTSQSNKLAGGCQSLKKIDISSHSLQLS